MGFWGSKFNLLLFRLIYEKNYHYRGNAISDATAVKVALNLFLKAVLLLGFLFQDVGVNTFKAVSHPVHMYLY